MWYFHRDVGATDLDRTLILAREQIALAELGDLSDITMANLAGGYSGAASR